MKKEVFGKLFYVIIGIGLAVITIEIALLLIPDIRPNGIRYFMMREKDAYLGFKDKLDIYSIVYTEDFEPHLVETMKIDDFKGIGFRDDGIDGDVFAVAVGDSFTWCGENAIEDCWVEILENKLGKDVVNMGVSGYSAIQKTRMLETYGVKLKPKIVLWQFFQNDLDENIDFMEIENGDFVPTLNEFLNYHSNVYILTKVYLKRATAAFKPPVDIPYYKDGEFFQVFTTPNTISSYQSEAMMESERLTKDALLKANQLSKDIGAEFVVVMIPSKEKSYFHIVKDFLNLTEDHTTDYADVRIKNFLIQNNITYIDLVDEFQMHAKNDEILYIKRSGHLNPAGNNIVANSVYEFLDSIYRPYLTNN